MAIKEAKIQEKILKLVKACWREKRMSSNKHVLKKYEVSGNKIYLFYTKKRDGDYAILKKQHVKYKEIS